MPPLTDSIFTLITQSRPAATVAPLNVRIVSGAAGLKVADPQLLICTAGTAATRKPVGRLSVKFTPVRLVFESVLGLVIVNVSEGVSPIFADSLPKTLLIDGGATTTMLAVLEALPVPPSVELMTEVVLSLEPRFVPYTRTLTVQVAFARMVPLLKVKLVAPEEGPKVGLPQPTVLTVGVVQTARPDGRASVNATPVRVVLVFGFTTKKVSVVKVVVNGILGTAKALLIVGGATTVNKAVLEVVPGLLSVEVITPVVLDKIARVVPLTLTDTVQDVLRSKDTPSIPRLVAPATGTGLNFAEAPQSVAMELAAGGLAISIPVGKLSPKVIPLKSVVVFRLRIVKVSVVLPLIGMAATANALLTVGAKITVNVSAAVPPFPPLVDVTAVDVFALIPPVVAMTSTLIKQVTPGSTEAPEIVNSVFPASGLNVGEPQFVTDFAGVAATCKPSESRLSVKPTPVNVVRISVLVTVKVKVLVSPTRIVLGLKVLLIAGGATTIRLAVLEVRPVPPSVELMTDVVLSFEPWLVPRTRTLTVQVAPERMLPLLKVRLVAPADGAKVGVPQPTLLGVGVVQTVRPVGRLSVNATPFRVLPALGFTREKVSVA